MRLEPSFGEWTDEDTAGGFVEMFGCCVLEASRCVWVAHCFTGMRAVLFALDMRGLSIMSAKVLQLN
jgi:hypothetical protein